VLELSLAKKRNYCNNVYKVIRITKLNAQMNVCQYRSFSSKQK